MCELHYSSASAPSYVLIRDHESHWCSLKRAALQGSSSPSLFSSAPCSQFWSLCCELSQAGLDATTPFGNEPSHKRTLSIPQVLRVRLPVRVRTLLLVGWRIKSRVVVFLVLYIWNGEIGVMYSCLAHFVLIFEQPCSTHFSIVTGFQWQF